MSGRNKRVFAEFSGLITIALLGGATFMGLYFAHSYSYVLFHSLAELFSIIVASSIFIIFWNARNFVNGSCFAVIAISCLFIALIDAGHTLAYQGMGIFSVDKSDFAIQLWISARYLQALSLLAASFMVSHRLNVRWLLFGGGAFTLAVFLSIFYWKVFPVCWIPETGLTPFKKISEYLICLLLAGAAAAFFVRRHEFDRRVLRFLMGAIVISALSEVSFARYTNPYGFANMAGHLLKIMAFYLFYKALIQVSLREPFAVLFKDLKEHREMLENQVKERTAKLKRANASLSLEIAERASAGKQLLTAQRQFDFSLEKSRIGTWNVDLVDHSSSRTRVHDQIFGYDMLVPDWTYEMFLEHVLPEDRPQVDRKFKDAIASQTDLDNECRIRRRDGEIRWIWIAGSCIKNQAEKSLRMSGIVQDITERKVAEEALLMKMDELQRWQTATLGREGRIGELKNEVNELTARLGEPPVYGVLKSIQSKESQ